VRGLLSEERDLSVGIVGSGRFGTAAAGAFLGAGAQVRLASVIRAQRTVDVPSVGRALRTTTVADLGSGLDLVLLAFRWEDRECLIDLEVEGRPVLVDATNPTFGRSRGAVVPGGGSSRELTRLAPRLPVVKALNTVSHRTLGKLAYGRRPSRILVPVSGEEADARATVIAAIEAIGCTGVDCGSLRLGARLHEPGGALFSERLSLPRVAEVLKERAG
jgi:8-hydroxy-5-deazaflavin:NADPH oxidoreductase